MAFFKRDKGNINYKYLRRRESWFKRNLTAIIVIFFIMVIVAALIVAGIIMYKNGVFNFNKASDNSQITLNTESSEDDTSKNGETTTNATNITWIDESRTVDEKYIAPEGESLAYKLEINISTNIITIYGIDSSGKYSIPIFNSYCASGSETDPTPVGEYKIYERYQWGDLETGRSHYVCRYNGDYYIGSSIYTASTPDTLDMEKYNLLGTNYTHGAVLLNAYTAEFIYNNCPNGTVVTIIADANANSKLTLPNKISLTSSMGNTNWDPTDSSEDNPWNKLAPSIEAANEIKTTIGNKKDLLGAVKAIDSLGQDISKDVKVYGKYTFDLKGSYKLEYYVKDSLGKEISKEFILIVE